MADKYTRYRQRNSSKPFYKYRIHRQNARARGIPFRLTFEQWWRIWQRSGKWKQRGKIDERGKRGRGYCMARPGDQGAYEVWQRDDLYHWRKQRRAQSSSSDEWC